MAVVAGGATVRAQCVAISKNTNSFGLRHCIFVAADGRVFAAASSQLNLPRVGEVVEFRAAPGGWGTYATCRRSWELPEILPLMPADMVRRVLDDVAIAAATG